MSGLREILVRQAATGKLLLLRRLYFRKELIDKLVKISIYIIYHDIRYYFRAKQKKTKVLKNIKYYYHE